MPKGDNLSAAPGGPSSPLSPPPRPLKGFATAQLQLRLLQPAALTLLLLDVPWGAGTLTLACA